MYSRVLVPLDGSELAQRAVPHAQALARAFGATVHLLQVVSRYVELETLRGAGEAIQAAEMSRDLGQRIVTNRIDSAGQYLKQLAGRLEADGIRSETAVREGAAPEQIPEYAEEQNIDLIVMSTHGYGGIRRFLIGSVTDRVIRSSNVPVLVIPPE
jgi:nucleotide-binding universal stress UspA family protein